MLKKYGLYLWVVLLFLVACAKAETAVIKEHTAALATKPIVITPSATMTWAEVLTDVAADGVVAEETAVTAPIVKQGVKVERLMVVFVPEAAAETAALASHADQPADLLSMLATDDVPGVATQDVVGKTAVTVATSVETTNQSANTVTNDEQQTNQDPPQSVPQPQIDDSEDEPESFDDNNDENDDQDGDNEQNEEHDEQDDNDEQDDDND